MRRLLASVVIGLALAAAAGPAVAAEPLPKRDVLVVSNNWDGTADFIDTKTFKRVKRLNIIPDAEEREAEIESNPADLGYFLAIRELVGEGHDQYVDDSFTSPNGRFLYVSRPSFADVVAFDLKTDKIVWRVPVEGTASRPHGDLEEREAAARLGLDGPEGARDQHAQGRHHAQLRVGRPAAREQLLRGREDDLPRVDRHRLHGHRRPRHGLDQGRPVVRGGGQRDVRGEEADRHGAEARGGGIPGPELRGPADGAGAGRALPVLPGLVHARVRRVRPEAGQGAARRGASRSQRRAARAVSARLSPPWPGDERARDQALRGGDDGRLRRDRQAQGLRLQAHRGGREAVLGDELGEWAPLLHVRFGRRPRLGHLVSARARGRSASRSATTRNGCGRAGSARRTWTRPRAGQALPRRARARSPCPRPRARRAGRAGCRAGSSGASATALCRPASGTCRSSGARTRT